MAQLYNDEDISAFQLWKFSKIKILTKGSW